METVIFAAGKGSRMGNNYPKALLKIDDQYLIQYQLDAINKVFPGTTVHIMSGFRYDLMKEAINEFSGKYNLKIKLERNPFYETGILSTAWIASLLVQSDDILRIDGDVLFTADQLSKLKNIQQTTFLISSVEYPKHSPEIVFKNDGSIDGIVIREKYVGPNEWVCIERYLHNHYRNIIKNVFDILPETAYFYEAVNAYLSSGKNFHFEARRVSVTYEMDTQEDLIYCIKNKKGSNS